MEIKKEMKIGEVIRKYPKTVKVFIRYNLGCVSCPMAEPESIEEAAEVHGLNIDEFLMELNKVVSEK
ncbi:MAG: DUF1858 domain-containing protein [Candidatus Nealsonbacteria bacterium]|nr:DUF1858 domain-containing protein [Candidatus Nealsonbacteria bacterium]